MTHELFQSCTSSATPQINEKDQQYNSYDARLSSLITWPRHLKHYPTTLGIAGFWYTGKPPKHIVMSHCFLTFKYLRLFFSPTGSGDTTICFHYGVGLKDRHAAEDPWAHHAIWSSFSFTSDT